MLWVAPFFFFDEIVHFVHDSSLGLQGSLLSHRQSENRSRVGMTPWETNRWLSALTCISKRNTFARMIGKADTLREQVLVRLDSSSKEFLRKAAELRRISVSDYVRQITVTQARREVEEAGCDTIALTRDEQMRFWKALNAGPKPTRAQRELSAIMRGKS